LFALETAPSNRAYCDHIFVASVLLLTGAGLVTLWTASTHFAEKIFEGDTLYIISRQGVLALAGIAVFIILSRIKIEFIRMCVPFLIFLSAVLCILTFIPGISMQKKRRYTLAPFWFIFSAAVRNCQGCAAALSCSYIR
jgi:cell division protein FtsW